MIDDDQDRPAFDIPAILNDAAARHAAGDLAAAAKLYRAVLGLAPDQPDALHLLGVIANQSGRPEEAIALIGRALEQRPDDPAALYNLGNAHRALLNMAEAIDRYLRVLTLVPDDVDALTALGQSLVLVDRPDEAVAPLRKAKELRPQEPGTHLNLGNAHKAAGRFEEAVAAYRDAVRLAPGSAAAHSNLGNALAARGDVEEATACLRRAVDLAPSSDAVLCNIAALERNAGALAEAEATFRRALAVRPDNAQAWYGLSTTKRFTPGDPDAEAIDRLLARPDLPASDRVYLCHAAAKASADAGEPADATFARMAEGARLKRNAIAYDLDADLDEMAAIAHAFPADAFAASPSASGRSAVPVLIVGMPRSGTTLVEQILASHPAVHGEGECLILPRLIAERSGARGRPYPAWVRDTRPDDLARLGQRYAATLAALAPEARRVTDKLPENFRHLGLIARALPGARVIHVRRAPADTCLSCFSTLFAQGNGYSYDLTELGRYYRAYDALMAHWRAALPAGTMAEVAYEDLIDDPRGEIGRLLAFLDLAWSDACLDFARADRYVGTASAAQVRRPLSRASIGRWKAYRDHLGPLFEALGPDLSP